MKARDYRRLRQQREVTADVTLPSGAVFTLRRPSLDLWIASGRMPQTFLRAMLETQQATPGAQVVFSAEETMDGIHFVRDLVCFACVSPRVATNPASEDVLDLAELDAADYQFLASWVQAGSPDVPVQTESGEVPQDGIGRFRQKQPGRAVSPGDDGQ
jgi:hypothetical protein